MGVKNQVRISGGGESGSKETGRRENKKGLLIRLWDIGVEEIWVIKETSSCGETRADSGIGSSELLFFDNWRNSFWRAHFPLQLRLGLFLFTHLELA
jgi:hypothetical protein